jgi:hypothetical protein
MANKSSLALTRDNRNKIARIRKCGKNELTSSFTINSHPEIDWCTKYILYTKTQLPKNHNALNNKILLIITTIFEPKFMFSGKTIMLKKIIRLGVLLPVISQAQAIPEEIKVPASTHSVLTLHAKGEQIYQCNEQQNQYSWNIKEPNALLFDTSGQLAGSHTAGPEWKYKDGSRIQGQVIKKIDVTPDSAIPWLLLETTKTINNGVLAKIRFIQRINTRGGLPPASDCNNNHLGIEKPVTYSADYIFYAEK